MKIVISEKERGLLFKNGRFVRMLEPGKQSYNAANSVVRTMCVAERFNDFGFDFSVYTRDRMLMKELDIAEVGDMSIALHFVDGNFTEILTTGKYVYWNVFAKHEFRVFDIYDAEVSPKVPRYVFSNIPNRYYTKIEVPKNRKAMLFYDMKPVKYLAEGVYYYWNNGVKIEAECIEKAEA